MIKKLDFFKIDQLLVLWCNQYLNNFQKSVIMAGLPINSTEQLQLENKNLKMQVENLELKLENQKFKHEEALRTLKAEISNDGKLNGNGKRKPNQSREENVEVIVKRKKEVELPVSERAKDFGGN